MRSTGRDFCMVLKTEVNLEGEILMKYTIISFYTLMNDDHHEGIKDVPPEDLELPL